MPNVKVLLNEKVDKLGEVGDVVNVRPGYARNYLLPQGLATIPTSGEVKRIQRKKELIEKQYQDEKIQAQGIADKINAIGKIVMLAKAGEAGKLFGRVTIKEITEKINAEAETEITRKEVLLKRSISELGEYDIKIKLHNEVEAHVKVVIKSEEES